LIAKNVMNELKRLGLDEMCDSLFLFKYSFNQQKKIYI